ncbi:MAG TPA: GNAT family N-acetyltransferase [Candidatus Pelethenecus sp.]|nr:GNAT family N-acetyltransferase [Candidatus Pelethenecus sp.]
METYLTYPNINSEITELRQEVFVKEQNVPYELEIETDEEKYLHFCLFENHILIAYARGRIEGTVARIGRVCVNKNYRRLGYGSKIMQYAEAELLPFNVQKYSLNAQVTAVEFYKQFGYQVVGEGFLEAGILHYPMIKPRKK